MKKFIGLKYNPYVDVAPKIHFKFQGFFPENILWEVKKKQIPIIKNSMLVEVLNKIEIHKEVPEELYFVISRIYKILYENGYIKMDI